MECFQCNWAGRKQNNCLDRKNNLILKGEQNNSVAETVVTSDISQNPYILSATLNGRTIIRKSFLEQLNLSVDANSHFDLRGFTEDCANDFINLSNVMLMAVGDKICIQQLAEDKTLYDLEWFGVEASVDTKINW